MRRIHLLVLVFLVTLGVSLPAQAGLIIQTGNNPQPDEENVLFNEPGLIGLGNPVTGITNQTGLLVTFTSDELLTTPSAGQARVEAVDGSFVNYTMAMPGSTFLDYIFNLNVEGTTGGTATIHANALGGFNLTGTFSIGVGSNFFTVYAVGGDRLVNVQVESDVALLDVRQNRISGAAPDVPTVPEPASLLLLGTGLAAFARRLRRRQ